MKPAHWYLILILALTVLGSFGPWHPVQHQTFDQRWPQ